MFDLLQNCRYPRRILISDQDDPSADTDVRSDDDYDDDLDRVRVGVRFDEFNRTVLYQKGALCNSVYEVCCSADTTDGTPDGKG